MLAIIFAMLITAVYAIIAMSIICLSRCAVCQ